MRKALASFIILLAALSLSCMELQAQFQGTDLYLTVGTETDDSFSFSPFFWTAGLSLDVHFGDLIMLSPECYIKVNNLKFGDFFFVPAVVLNFKFSSLFIGAGITKYLEVGSDIPGTPSSDIEFKFNAGVRGAFTKLSFYVLTNFNNLFQRPMTVGANIAFGF